MPLELAYPPIVLPAPISALPGPALRLRLDRAGPSLLAKLRRPRRTRSAAVAGISAVLGAAMLAWGGGVPPSPAQASTPRLQPVETAGQNFPGSAFYFLDGDSGVVGPSRAGTLASSDAPAPLDARLGDAIARPTFLSGSGEDKFRALHCLTTAIYYEAATEPDAGQRAVAQVVLNRVAHPQWPNSVCGVVFQGSERPGCQFSFACDGSMARAPARLWWNRARAVAERALAGEVYAPAGLATYYHTGAVNPGWASRVTYIGMIGAHLFYRPPGAEGRAAAFTDRYFGGEPSPAPRPRAIDPPGDAPPLFRAGEAAPPVPYAAVLPAPATAVPSLPDTLPAAGRIRPEYRNSGRWIAAPDS